MSHVFHRNLRSQYPIAVKGEGVYLIDSEGQYYLDACGGAAVSCLGHSDPSVIAALKSQSDSLCYAHSGFFTSEPMEQLADFLTKRAPEGLDYAYFVSGGFEAVEAALKLARQYYIEKFSRRERDL
ncbi:aminotransferase class III-fold pyridoxal phosphate-dependent enzyme [uncultured Shewanella sp.]|uniref:aminotransferase class III-fold pyridoxal phosphate-dependent enzyme n=1 Tax=uncultured Shewanella sp. TaxID=173975 RepID=UPI002604DC8A|nr:aminotransferase class III-fold pyridoxal phosphate-dependent enzyme [uncultured Shewanella sp.]